MSLPLILLAVTLGAGALVLTGQVALALVFGAAVALGAAFLLWRRRRTAVDWIVVDGSNVMFWQGDPPQLQVVRDVLDRLRARGLEPVVWFDANAGYRLSDSYLGPEALAARLNLPARQVFVAPRGTPADPLLLDGATTLGARIVSNDHYRDWVADYPVVDTPGMLIRGRVIGGLVALDFGGPSQPRATAPIRR